MIDSLTQGKPAQSLNSALSTAAATASRYWILTTSVLGMVLGGYLWQFLSTNQDFTGPQTISLSAGLALICLVGPLVVWIMQALSALIMTRLSDEPFTVCLRQDSLSLWPLGLLGLSPLLALLTGQHSTAYHAGVAVFVSLVFSGCLALKAANLWQIRHQAGVRRGMDDPTARRILVGLMVAYAAIFATLQVLRYNAFQLWGVDNSMVAQALWNTLHGRFLAFTFVDGIDLNLLSDHFEPVFALFVPFYRLWPDPRLPLMIQSVVVSLAAWPVYRMALRRLKSPALALGWALAYLILPMTVAAAQDSGGEARPDTLAIAIFMFMLDALDRENWGIFALTVVLTFGAKEYFSLLVAMLGLYIALRQRRRMLGLGLFVTGVLWFVALLQWIMPAMRNGPNLTLAARFGSSVGENGLAGMIPLLLQAPGQVLAQFFTYDQFMFVFFLLFSYGVLPVLNPLLAAVSLPIFVIFGLASQGRPGPVDLGNLHYFPALPFFLVAAIDGVMVLKGLAGRHMKINPQPVAVGITALGLSMSLASGFFWASGPLSWTFWDRRSPSTYAGNRYVAGQHALLANEFVQMVPPEAPVLASDFLFAHLANRPRLYHFFWPPEDVLDRVDYTIVDLFENHAGREDALARQVALVDELFGKPDFALTAHEDGLLFFQRDAADGYVSQVEVLTASTQPQARVERDLGGRLRLLGYDPPAGPLRAGERARVTYYWQVLDGFARPFDLKLGINPQSVETHQTDYVLADRFAGPAGGFRVLHLPTYVQAPPQQWQPGQILRETFDFRLPAAAQGEYDWSVGLYAVPKALGIQVTPERQVPGTEPISLGTLIVQR